MPFVLICLFAVSCILVQDVPAQDEAERLAETVRATFSLEKLPESFHLDETDFVHGLPKVSRSFSIFPTYSKLLMNQTLNTMFRKSFFSRNSLRTSMDDRFHPTKVLLCFLHMAEQVVAKPPRPSDVTHR